MPTPVTISTSEARSGLTDGDRRRAKAIIGRYPHAKSALLPLLHLAQDRNGWVTPAAMEEIAEMLDLTPALVLGTCSFYTMFKREPAGALVVSVCTNVSCLVNGGPDLLEALRYRFADDGDVLVEEVECLAACDAAPVLQVNYEYHNGLTAAVAIDLVEQYRRGELAARTISGTGTNGTRRTTSASAQKSSGTSSKESGKKATAKKATTKTSSTSSHVDQVEHEEALVMAKPAPEETRIVTKFLRARPNGLVDVRGRARSTTRRTRAFEKALGMEPAAIVEQVSASGLRGRGGAGFGTGQKWSFLPKGVYPRYLAVNADEGEPATFKDHMLIEGDPHQIIEGVAITAYAIEAHHAFIYIRGEFALGAERLQQAVDDAYANGYLGENILESGFDLEVIVHRGAGLLHRRRRDGAAVEPRGRARDAADQAAVPRRAGALRRADGREQRRDDVDDPAHHPPRGQVVRGARREQVDRHADLLGVRHGRAARRTTRSSSA